MQEYNFYRSNHSDYAGNFYTYYIFKQLIKLFLTEVYLYKYKGAILTYKELILAHKFYVTNQIETIKSLSQWVKDHEITKLKYKCIKVTDPSDINYLPLSTLNLHLIDVSKLNDFSYSYESLIKKTFDSFWDYNQEYQNINLKETFKIEPKSVTTNTTNLSNKNNKSLNFKFSRDIIPLITLIAALTYFIFIIYLGYLSFIAN